MDWLLIMIDIKFLTEVKEILGQSSIDALAKLYKQLSGEPPSYLADKFRVENSGWLDLLDDLERSRSLIERTKDYKSYLLRCYALPLIDDVKAIRTLELMQVIYIRLKYLYPLHLSKSLSIETLLEGVSGIHEEKLEALYYLSECHDVWSGKSTGFPFVENSELVISESVLRHENISEILVQFFEWHFINPKHESIDLNKNLFEEQDNEKEGFFVIDANVNMPGWYDRLDDVKQALIGEINIAMINNLTALPTIGLRTLIDIVMVEKIGDVGTFNKKLEQFEKNGFATKNQIQLLAKVLDAGNASAHRAYFPNKEDIRTCVDVVKHLLHGIYILGPQVTKLVKNTPKRS